MHPGACRQTVSYEPRDMQLAQQLLHEGTWKWNLHNTCRHRHTVASAKFLRKVCTCCLAAPGGPCLLDSSTAAPPSLNRQLATSISLSAPRYRFLQQSIQ